MDVMETLVEPESTTQGPYTVNQILDRYQAEVLPSLKERTRVDYARHIVLLRREFGSRIAGELRRADFEEFLNPPTGRINRERCISTLASAFTCAVQEWGWLETNICRDLPRFRPESKAEVISAEVLEKFRKFPKTPSMHHAVELVLLTGRAAGHIYTLKWSQVQKDAIIFYEPRSDKPIEVPRTPEMDVVLAGCKKRSPNSEYVISRRNGEPYTSNGFRAIWQRLMRRWTARGYERFDFHDLRVTSRALPKKHRAPENDLPASVDSPAVDIPLVNTEKAIRQLSVCEPFSFDAALESIFMDEQTLLSIVKSLRNKKNVILQGPPGVGKSHIARTVAFALMGEKAFDRVQMIQFHQSYSYEDFLQGYRPSGDGFKLKNGLFYEFCRFASHHPDKPFVFIIDEINRGNLAKVFGEIMLLMDADKRGPEWAVPLAYSESIDNKFYIPENVFLLGLMNTADRSLAVVDYALRRRFTFIDLEPQYRSNKFRAFLQARGADASLVDHLVSRLTALNEEIRKDTSNLGPGYEIGHSFFCCIPADETPNLLWYQSIVTNEIRPLLAAYFFDDVDRAKRLLRELLSNE